MKSCLPIEGLRAPAEIREEKTTPIAPPEPVREIVTVTGGAEEQTSRLALGISYTTGDAPATKIRPTTKIRSPVAVGRKTFQPISIS